MVLNEILMECKSLTALITNCLLLLVSFSLDASITISEVIETEEKCDLSNGTITIIVDGDTEGLMYSIDGGDTYQSSNFFDGLESRDYLIRVIRGGSCSDVYTAQIADASTPQIAFDFGCQDGTGLVDIDLVPFTTGLPPFSFSWTGPSGNYNTEDLIGVSTGEYSLSVVDRDGCQVDTSFLIPICCSLSASVLPSSEEISCKSELEDLTEFEFENLSTSEIIIDLKDKLGIVIQGDPCNDINVSITQSESAEADCEESKRIEYIIDITDGVSTRQLSKVYFLENHKDLALISDAEQIELSCDSDLDLALADYINVLGGAKIKGCPSKYTTTTLPENLNLALDCQGNGSLEIEFLISDICGNSISTSGNFIVVDNKAPQLTCPDELELDLAVPDLMESINEWLATASATDNCSQVALTNDFDFDQLASECITYKEIVFQAQDECDNTSTCIGTISAFNNGSMSLICPDSVMMGCTELIPDSLFYQLLARLELESQLPYDLTYDYSIDVYDIDCDFVYQFSAEILMTNACNEEAACKINLEVEPDPQVYIANVFTPSDNRDNKFTVYANPVIEEIEVFHIYNRWGETVYEEYNFQANDESIGWNGVIKNEHTGIEVFTYYALCRSITGKALKYVGNVTLLK